VKYLFLSLTLLVSSLALAQAAPQPAQQPAGGAAAQTPSAAQEVAPDAPVITIYDLCKERLTNMGACKTVITRAQFDKFLQALGYTQVPPQARREVATQYVRMMTLAMEAEKEGIESRPEVQELLRLAREQALAQALRLSIQQRSQATPEQVQKFYEDNKDKLTKITFDRVVVPVKGNEAELKQYADQLRQRAANGTDFKTLQAEAYERVAMQNPPETRLVTQPSAVPASQKAILDLQPGGVSSVMQENGRLVFYKLVSKEPIPLDQVKDQIQKVVAQNKAQQEEALILNSAKPNLNPEYFGPAPEPSKALSQQ
jgi:hypothetical protein